MGAEFVIQEVRQPYLDGHGGFYPYPDMEAAFDLAKRQAAWDHGHSGYTGSLAEKGSVVFITRVDTFSEAGALAYDIDDNCIDAPRPEDRTNPEYPQYASDKWGPAGAIKVANEGWLFFGWCSS